MMLLIQPFLDAIGHEMGYGFCPGCGRTMWPGGRGGTLDDVFHTLWYQRRRGVTIACRSCWSKADPVRRQWFVSRLMDVWRRAGCHDPALEIDIREAAAVA